MICIQPRAESAVWPAPVAAQLLDHSDPNRPNPRSNRRQHVLVDIEMRAAGRRDAESLAILPACQRSIQVAMPEPTEAATTSPVEAPSTHDVALEGSLRQWIDGVVRRDEAAFTQLYNA